MAAFGRDITKTENCGSDYQNRHPMVLQAYYGFIAYQPLYQAGCLRDSTGNYCTLPRPLETQEADADITLHCRLRKRHH